MISIFSGSRETSGENADTGDKEPSLSAFDCSFEVFGEATIASEPSKGAFDDPALGLGLEVPDPLGSGDDLDPPPAELCRSLAKLIAAVDPIAEDVAQLRECGPQRTQQGHRLSADALSDATY